MSTAANSQFHVGDHGTYHITGKPGNRKVFVALSPHVTSRSAAQHEMPSWVAAILPCGMGWQGYEDFDDVYSEGYTPVHRAPPPVSSARRQLYNDYEGRFDWLERDDSIWRTPAWAKIGKAFVSAKDVVRQRRLAAYTPEEQERVAKAIGGDYGAAIAAALRDFLEGKLTLEDAYDRWYDARDDAFGRPSFESLCAQHIAEGIECERDSIEKEAYESIA